MIVVFLHGLTASGGALLLGISLDEDVPPVDMMVFPPPLRLFGLALDGVVGVAGPLVALPPTSPISPLPSDDDCARSATRVSSPPEGASATALEGGVRLWIPCLSNRGDRLEDGDRRTGMAVGRSSAGMIALFCAISTEVLEIGGAPFSPKFFGLGRFTYCTEELYLYDSCFWRRQAVGGFDVPGQCCQENTRAKFVDHEATSMAQLAQLPLMKTYALKS
jgi:hypothetical protein